ncbi:protein of unknown function [Streptomyces murinus]
MARPVFADQPCVRRGPDESRRLPPDRLKGPREGWRPAPDSGTNDPVAPVGSHQPRPSPFAAR